MKNTTWLLLLILLLATNINAQITLIPDANFEQELVNQGIDSDATVNGQILTTDAASVLKLELSNSLIQDLAGVEAFINMDSLLCSTSNIDTLDLSSLSKLQYVYFANSPLRDFKVNGCDSLKSLHLDNNDSLVNLTIDSLPALQYFNFFLNRELTDLRLSNCPTMKVIRGGGNTSLDTLDLSGIPSVSSVLLPVNGINAINLTNCNAIEYLDVQGNNLTRLEVPNRTNLANLHCSGNQINNLNVSNCTELDTLNCSLNNIGILDLSTNIDLKHIRCHQNQLTSLLLANSTNLKNLYCHQNQLSTLDVSNNTNLNVLTCGENQLSTLNLNNNSQITVLNCVENRLLTLNLSMLSNLNTLSCGANLLTELDLSQNILLRQLTCDFNKLEEVDLSHNALLISLFITSNKLKKLILGTPILRMHANNNPAYLVICLPSIPFNKNWNIDATTVTTTTCFPQAVTGRVITDSNNNCLVDSTESFNTTALLKFVSATDTVFVQPTDSTGFYRAYLDTGTYQVSVEPQFPYWQSCTSSQIVIVDTNYNIQTIDWVLEPVINCPLMTVDLSAPFLRMTGGGSAYTISYCNQGTEAAYNAYVEVELDEDLTFITSTIPTTTIGGTNNYRFDLDTVEVGDCGSFQIQVVVDTSSMFEQTHCTRAHIYPDSICIPVASKPIVGGKVSCQNDTVFFRIENRGIAMTQRHNYTVIQDDIAMRVGTVQLGAGQSMVVAQAALPGRTYRIEVEQAPNFPNLLGDSIFSMVIEGCQKLSGGGFNTGFVTQFSNGLGQPFEAIDCQQNIASYDPNDKSAQPIGYGPQNYIYANTAIDYKVRFQNTGTDTAFNITIIDTLSAHVDISTLLMGASSHDYTWSITSDNVLRVDFANIMLPDSNVNEPLSNGFFRYRIEQIPNNPVGTLIENQAAIYFDYNPPIFTNTTFHTVGEDFVPEILVSVDNPQEATLDVKVFPNPFGEETTLQIDNKHYEELRLEVYDLMGRKVKSVQAFDTNQVVLKRGNMEQGVYFYRLEGDNQLISTGKIQVKY